MIADAGALDSAVIAAALRGRPAEGELRPTVSDCRSIFPTQELNAMLLHEVLARTRMQEDQRWASQARLARRLAAARRWQWLARYADRRARRAVARL